MVWFNTRLQHLWIVVTMQQMIVEPPPLYSSLMP